MGVRQRAIAWSLGLTAVLAVAITLSAGIGAVWIPPATVVKVLLNAVSLPTGIELAPLSVAGTLQLPVPTLRWQSAVAYPVDQTAETIVMRVRLPRILLAATVGFALAAAGTVMQGFFRNPMADPSIIGVSSGAAVGAVAAIVAPAAIPFGLGCVARRFSARW
jgi:ABC-type Fe3+-siderophore transport system, permease component